MRILLPAVLLLLLLTNTQCKKDRPAKEPEGLQGSWRLLYSYGGWSGKVYPPPGSLTVLTFMDSTVQTYAHDTLVKEEAYHIKVQWDEVTKRNVNCIATEANPEGNFSGTEIRHDTLVIFAINAVDGGGGIYKRYRR